SATVTVVVKTLSPGDIIDSATLVAKPGELNPDNNNPSLTTTVRGFADVAISQIDTPDPVLVSSNLTYSITITNKGPWPATGMLLTNVFSPNANFVTATQRLLGDYFRDDTNLLSFEFYDPLPVNVRAPVTV